MQLLILLFFLLGGADGRNFREVKDIAQELGGEEIKSAIEDAEKIYKEAEQIQSLISAVRTAFDGEKNDNFSDLSTGPSSDDAHTDGCEFAPHGFPLEPVSSIADEKILFCLSRYIATGI